MSTRKADTRVPILILSTGAMLAGGSPASAGDAGNATSVALEEIIVTATRRSESIQNVPIAVSAFTSELRDRIRMEGVQDLTSFTPGLMAQDEPDDRLIIRGVGRTTNAPGSDPGVGVYVDGVYTTGTGDISGNPMTIDRIEVLRGPQGTLYGRNTVGGAVNVISKRPTKDWSGEVRAGYGSYNYSFFGGSFGGPVTDSVRVRLDASKEDRDGFIENIGPGNDLADIDNMNVSGQVDWDITDKLHLWVRANYSGYDQAPDFRVLRQQWRNDIFHEGLVIHPWYGYTEVNPAINNPWQIRQDENQSVENDANTVSTQLTYEAEGFTVRYIAGYNDWDWKMHYDGDGIAQTKPVNTVDLAGNAWTVPVQGTVDTSEVKDFHSHELQFLSNNDGALDWVGGLYYYHEDIDGDWDWRTPGNEWLQNAYLDGSQANWWETGSVSLPNPEARGWYQRGVMAADSYAAYGQMGYELNEQWKVTGGLRYTNDKKDAHEFRQWWWMPQAWWLGTNGPLYSLLNPATGEYEAASITGRDSDKHSASWSAVTGMMSAEYRPNAQTLWYLTLSQGSKAGGFLLGAIADLPDTKKNEAEVGDEKLMAYEFGYKSDLTETLRVNAAAYYYDYKDMQTQVQVKRGSLSFNELRNAHKATAYGLELEAFWQIASNTSANVSASFARTELDDFCGNDFETNPDGSTGCLKNWQRPGIAYDPSGNVIPQTPETQWAANLSQNIPVSYGTFNVNATYAYVGPVEYSLLFLEGSRAPSYDRTDLNLSFQDTRNRYRVSLYAKNVFDSERPTKIGQDGPLYGPINWAYYTYPRVYGAEVRFMW